MPPVEIYAQYMHRFVEDTSHISVQNLCWRHGYPRRNTCRCVSVFCRCTDHGNDEGICLCVYKTYFYFYRSVFLLLLFYGDVIPIEYVIWRDFKGSDSAVRNSKVAMSHLNQDPLSSLQDRHQWHVLPGSVCHLLPIASRRRARVVGFINVFLISLLPLTFRDDTTRYRSWTASTWHLEPRHTQTHLLICHPGHVLRTISIKWSSFLFTATFVQNWHTIRISFMKVLCLLWRDQARPTENTYIWGVKGESVIRNYRWVIFNP
jgi:hypothetical protein